MVAVLPLAISLLISPLVFDIRLRKLKGDPLTLISPQRNLTLSVFGSTLQAETTRIAPIQVEETLTITIECLTDTSLHISTLGLSSLINSPSLCGSANALIIDEESLHGCISNIYHGNTLLLDRLCSNGDSSSEEVETSSQIQAIAPESSSQSGLQPVHVAEPLEVNEGGSIPLQWKNVYILPENRRGNVSQKEIRFSLVDGPRHGSLSLSGSPTASFTYADLLARNVVYKHDGSETREDSFDFQVEMNGQSDYPWMESSTYTMKITINPVNDPPEIMEGTGGAMVRISSKGSRVLNGEILRVQDPDDAPDKIRVQVVEAKGVHLKLLNKTTNEFTQRQLLAGMVSIVDDGISDHSSLRLLARDRESRSAVLDLRVVSVPIGVHLVVNSGVRLLHHSSSLISKQNLSFAASVPDLALEYRLVQLPDHGIVECSQPHSHFTVCSTFTQDQINQGLVRFRHTGSGHPNTDSFSFQVESGDFVSIVHTFRLMFIPMNVKVFNREVFMLNGTDHAVLDRRNIFAWTFPKSFSPEKLTYHIIEPPKFGILSRKIGVKNRRIGVSSNFTQQDIDQGLISFRLHFMQYSIMNDFFLFRVISPAVSSETQRFEIVFVPSATSIQLINRTVIVREGGIAEVNSDFLSLSTADDKNFVFTISIPPRHGRLCIKLPNGGKQPLTVSNNFTTAIVNDGRLFYEHSDDESRNDLIYLEAESAFRAGTRIPFWISFSVILKNDNKPTLIGSDVIHIVERGERILQPFLLDWKDPDIDSHSLQFNFDHAIKDAAILSTVSPHLPMSTFSQSDMKHGKVMIRHLGHKANFSIDYTVSDGLHTTAGILHVVASDPFVVVQHNNLEYCCVHGDAPQIAVNRHNLSVLTNLDITPSDIHYSTPSVHFMLKQNGTVRVVGKFTQQDINEGRLFYNVHSAKKEPLTIVVVDRKLYSEALITLKSLGAALELRRAAPISVPVGGVTIIDNDTLLIGGSTMPPESLIYFITQPPTEGNLLLEGGPPFVAQFSQADINSRKVQYLHTGNSEGRDSFQMNISSPHMSKGPYVLYVDIYDHHVSLNTSAVTVVDGGSTVVSSLVVQVTSSDKDDYVLKVVKPPQAGWIVRDSWNLANITSLDSFTGTELRERRVVYVSDRSATAPKDSFQLIACIGTTSCTTPRTVDVLITQMNKQSPHLLRNEVLRVVHADSTPITNSHLGTEDADTASENVHFLISRPSNGHVARIQEPTMPIYNFSQKDVDEHGVAFFAHPNASGSGGFSFLISDGVHQVGPEWFTIETRSGEISVALEANSRLIASPDVDSVISIDLLRANIPNAAASQILFSVTKAPRHGKLFVNGIESHRFSQLDVNRRMVYYLSNSSQQAEWTKRDTFNFVVTVNTSTQPVDEEYRFRITSTYAVLPQELIQKWISTSALMVSKGGSTALNLTHLNVEKLASIVSKEELLLEIARSPRHGECDWLDSSRHAIPWKDFSNGMALIYKHLGTSDRDDEIILYLYPVSESTRRSSRLRITVPIKIMPIRDPLLQVVNFPHSMTVVSGGATPIERDMFLASHPRVPPQSIIYQIAQNGLNGAKIRVTHKNRDMFSQEELNQGLVSIVHTPVPNSPMTNDVLVLLVEGHTRTLVVKIRPLDLALENHTSITYPQGKTYIVLSRAHLGAYSNGDRSKITYRVTSSPENGTFYWVAGEKEAKQFTQQDIDEGRVLYAQLNMHSYRDSFEFVMGNSEREFIRNRSEILVRSLVEPQPIIVESNTSTPITTSQLNATALQGSIPRFLVTSPPRYGRITLDPESEHSALFFTEADVSRGRVLYQAFGSHVEVTDNIELEVRADNVQPARLILPITVLPSDDNDRAENAGSQSAGIPGTGGGDAEEDDVVTPDGIPRLSPINNHLPILILVAILLLTVFILVCRLRNTKNNRKKSSRLEAANRNGEDRPSVDKPDLLGHTVFASLGRSDSFAAQSPSTQTQRLPMRTFESPRTSLPSQTPREKRRAMPSLDYAGFGTDTPPMMPIFKQLSKPPGDTHHWV